MRQLVVALVIAGCGSTSANNSTDADGAVSCISPVRGKSCSLSEIACQPSGPCVDYNWTCNENTGAWQTYPLGRPPCLDAALDQ